MPPSREGGTCYSSVILGSGEALLACDGCDQVRHAFSRPKFITAVNILIREIGVNTAHTIPSYL